MKRAGFSLGLIIVSNILIIGISMVYGLRLFSLPQNMNSFNQGNPGKYEELALKK